MFTDDDLCCCMQPDDLADPHQLIYLGDYEFMCVHCNGWFTEKALLCPSDLKWMIL